MLVMCVLVLDDDILDFAGLGEISPKKAEIKLKGLRVI